MSTAAIRRVERWVEHHNPRTELRFAAQGVSNITVADVRAVLVLAKSTGELRAEIRRMHGRECACVHCNPRRKAGK